MPRIFLILVLLFAGCAQPPLTTGSLGYEDARTVTIIGENVEPALAVYYQKKYGGAVWFTPYEGKLSKVTHNFLQSGIGPSVAMRGLARELKSINYTVGRWQIVVPKIAENYFLSTLKTMKAGELSKARGMVILIDSSSNPNLEKEVERTTGGSFFITYEFQKE